MKRFAFLIVVLLGACLPQQAPEPTRVVSAPRILSPEDNPYAPKIEDVGLVRAGIVLTAIQLSERTDLDPSRVQVNFLGSMPRTCNQLRLEVNSPDAEYRIHIEAYSLTDPNIKCENVFQQFETNILLGVYSPGRYTIWVNGNFIGDFVSY